MSHYSRKLLIPFEQEERVEDGELLNPFVQFADGVCAWLQYVLSREEGLEPFTYYSYQLTILISVSLTHLNIRNG